jgi:hypothetical protein
MLPSVTTLLGQVSEYYLDRWRANQIADAVLDRVTSGAWDNDVQTLGQAKARAALDRQIGQYLTRAADRGGLVHSWIEADAARECGYDIPYPELEAQHRPFIQAYQVWRRGHHVRWLALECTAINDTMGYAGTADALAEIDGVPSIMDYKTSKKLKTQVAAQLRALSKAEYLVGGDGKLYQLPPIYDHVALLLCNDGSHLPQVIEEVDAAYEMFLGLLRVWDFNRNARLGSRFLRPQANLMASQGPAGP